MNDLDAIEPGADTVMSAELVRLFKYAGCDPTKCHACGKLIRVGQVFKLLTHTKPSLTPRDEMCCAKCGEPELVKRDKRVAKNMGGYISMRGIGLRFGGGYSRPTKGTSDAK